MITPLRVRTLSTMLQYPLKLWHDTIGNPTVADAILDRLLHNAHCIELQGGSMRTRRDQTE